MMTLINAIPDYIGWMMVGAFGMLTLGMFGLLMGTVVDMVRERIADDEAEEC